MITITGAITRLLLDAYYRAKRKTSAGYKPHVRAYTVSELRALPYPDYLKSEHWQRMRRRAISLAGFRCHDCDDRQSELHVHHLNYDRVGRERQSDLRVLCKRCHEEMHKDG